MTNTIRTTQQICEDIKDNSMGLDSILRKNRTRNLGSFLKKQKSEVEQQVAVEAITKPPLLQESRLTGGGSPNLVVLVEWKVPVERFMGAANSVH